MRWWELFRQALAGAARARLRSALTAAGVAIGCGALVSMVAFAIGLQRQIEAPLKSLGMLNDIHVSPGEDRDRRNIGEDTPGGEGSGEDDEVDGKETKRNALLDDAALDAIRKLPGVRFAYPEMSLHDVEIARGEKSSRSLAMALPREAGAVEQFGELLIAGTFFSLDSVPEAIIAEGLLKDLGFASAAAAVGRQLSISTAGLASAGGEGEFQFQHRTLNARVVGVFRPPDFGGFGQRSLGSRTILLPIDLLEQLPGLVESQLWRMRRQGAGALDSYARAIVRAENPAVLPRLVKEIKAQGFEARTMLSRLEDFRTAFLVIESLLAAVGSVALVIAGLGIANTLLMTVLERYEEIGLYKAIGATDGDVRLMFVAEAAALGLVGSLVGLVLAGAVSWILQWGVNAYLAHEGVSRKADVFYFPLWLLAGAVVISTGLSIVSGLYPASRAARVDPIQALRRT